MPSRRSPAGAPLIFSRAVSGLTIALFVVFFFWPVVQILRGGFVDANGDFTLAYLGAMLRDPTYLFGLRNSFLLACATTLVALLIGVPLAWLSDRFRFPAQALLGSLVLVPLILPPFVGAIGIRQMFGQYGAFNALLHHLHLLAPGATIDWLATHRFWGVTLVEAFSVYPIIFLNVLAALGNLDPAMEEAAQNLGCTGLRRFVRITLPLIRPSLFAGGTIVFIWTFTELGTPLIFDYDQVTSVQIYAGLRDIGGNPSPYALVAVMLFSSVALYALGKGVFGRADEVMVAKATLAATSHRLRGPAAWLCTGAFGLVAGLAVLPHLGVVLVACSRDWYATVLPHEWTMENFRMALGHDLTVPAIANSLKYASGSTAIDLILGVAIAYVIARSRSKARHLLDSLTMLPLAVPGLVLAFGYIAMTREGQPFAFLNPTRNPTILLILAYAIRRLPYVVRAAVAGFQQTSPTLEEAAQNLGCPPLRSVAKITLPLITASLVAGGLLAFAFAMLEVSDSLILAQKQAFYPITKAIMQLFQLLGDGKFMASALGVWAMAFLGVILVGASVALGKRLGAVFRV